jgi:hypothetical protein
VSLKMGDRRKFFKQAGAIAGASWPGISRVRGRTTPATVDLVAMGVPKASPEGNEVVLENNEMLLVIAENGEARSLIHKPSGQECLAAGLKVPMFTATQYRPYDNELQLAYPAKVTSFPAEAVRRSGDKLVVTFPLVEYEATVGLRITENYIGFTLEKLEFKPRTGLRPKRKDPVDETLFVQLPVRARANLGDWLNVTWDDDLAVNLLATDPYARVDCKPYAGAYFFQAGTADQIATEGVGAALIVTATKNLLDRIAAVEEDYSLPRSVESRRRSEYRYSYYEMTEATPENIDKHIEYARRAGLRLLQMHYLCFAETVGHFEWRPAYPNGMFDLKSVVGKISRAGIIPGIHIHYNKCHKTDAYVTPKPDPRLNLSGTFTLAEPLDSAATTIVVEENPRLCTMDKNRRILKMQSELVTYEAFTTSPPYQFLRCTRGALNTKPGSYEAGSRVGLLDVDTWPIFVRFTQNTSIQEEVAARLGEIYREAGFKFTYFDGAEDVPPPFWFTVSRAQWVVWKQLEPKPHFAEGACKSHFSWHILTRGNAFDVCKPEVMKACTRAYPAAEAARVAKDFTSINFGWVGYWAPSKETIGTQPDMIEYVTSRAAAWDCPMSLVGNLEQMDLHPRTADNLEIVKRWEDVRASNWLTSAHKEALRNLEQEHTLLTNEKGQFELTPYAQIEKAAGTDQPVRAFVFERARRVWVVCWHTSGSARLYIDVPVRRVRLMKELGKEIPLKESKSGIQLPLNDRHYVEFANLSVKDVITAFQNSIILE